MDYLKTLVGIKYAFFNETKDSPPSLDKDEEPFWVGINHPLPNINVLQKNGMCCVGMINLVRRYLNMSIPSYIDSKKNIFIGGTEAWFQYLKSENRLIQIDYNKKYKEGTLLIQNYNSKDQGHVAIIYSSGDNLKKSVIIHSQGVGPKKEVVSELISESTNGYRYTHCCEDFLTVD